MALAEIKNDLSRYLHLAEREEVLITRHGKPAGVLIGFASEEEWIEYRIANHPEFVERIERARRQLQEGHPTRLEDLSE